MRNVYSMSTYIGETSSGARMPVMFDPHYPIQINQPPVTLITGQPGSGKTFLGLILGAHSSALGKLTVIIDPKNDFPALKKLESAGHLKNVHVWSIIGEGGKIDNSSFGLLDPLTLTDDPNINVSNTKDAIRSLVGEMTVVQENRSTGIIQEEANSDNPSMGTVIDRLQEDYDEEVRNLGKKLEVIFSLSEAVLLKSNKKHRNEKPDLQQGTIIISLMGLQLPPQSLNESQYTDRHRMAICIMSLLTNFVSNILFALPKTIFKTLIVDEAWTVFKSHSGSGLLSECGLKGRSLNMATILLTQKASHINTTGGEEGDSDLDTSISIRFAFRSRVKFDNVKTCEAMNIDSDYWADVFDVLGNGQCLLKDSRDNIAMINTVAPEEWTKIFSTKPKPKQADEETDISH